MTRSTIFVGITLAVGLLLSETLFTQSQESLRKVNLAKSKYSPGPAPRAAPRNSSVRTLV